MKLKWVNVTLITRFGGWEICHVQAGTSLSYFQYKI